MTQVFCFLISNKIELMLPPTPSIYTTKMIYFMMLLLYNQYYCRVCTNNRPINSRLDAVSVSQLVILLS